MLAVLLPPPHALAESAAEFYQGKTLRAIVSSPPGGGYNERARILATHLSRLIGTSLVVENMPGAGSMVSVSYTYNLAPKDGTTFCMFQRSLLTTTLMEPVGARFDLLKFNWLGSMGAENGLIVTWHTSPIKTTDDLFKKETVIGMAGGPMTSLTFNALIGTKLKTITGYRGSREIQVAMERGELMGMTEWSWSDIKRQHTDWLEQRKINLVLQIGTVKDKELRNVPLAQDFAKNDADRTLLDFVVSPRQLAYPLILPPDVPADRVAFMRDAFMRVADLAEFKAEMDKSGIEYEFMRGEDAAAFVARLVGSFTPEVAQRLKAVTEVK
jgi:tripartite-type tricarboxylate transporter receptor subunit TctC